MKAPHIFPDEHLISLNLQGAVFIQGFESNSEISAVLLNERGGLENKSPSLLLSIVLLSFVCTDC